MTPKLLYIHAPKCGGTSFGSALRLSHPLSQATIDLNTSRRMRQAMYPQAQGVDAVLREHEIRKYLLGDLLVRGVKCISAHVSYHRDLHQGLDPDRHAVTLLRDPVERFISHYHYVQRKHPDPNRPDTLAEFVESEMALRYGSIYLLYYASTHQHTCDDLEAALDEARSNLACFSVIGDLRNADAFRSALRHLAGRPLLYWERNKRPTKGAAEHRKKAGTEEISDALRARITEICAPDIALYNHAKTLPSFV